MQELQIFLGLTSFYHKYIRNYANITIPIINHSKDQDCSFFWGKEQQQILDKLKIAIAQASILSIVDSHKLFVVETVASVNAVKAMLL